MKLKEADARGVSEAEQFFLGLVKERQMSTFLPNAWALSPDELRVIFNLARVALRSAESESQEAAANNPQPSTLPAADEAKPGSTARKPKAARGLGPQSRRPN